MAYTEVVVEIERQFAEIFSDSLLEVGALSAIVEDADAGSEQEQALFGEPGGEPLEAAWNHSRIIALFDQDTTEDAQIDHLLTQAYNLAGIREPIAAQRRSVADQDWVRLTQAQFEPIHIGQGLWIVPSWHTPPAAALADARALILKLDPGLAFGTGSHPTTSLCLQWLEAHLESDAHVIDYGCGSGILAIAAKKLGAARVLGTDIDPHAVVAAQANALDNQVDVQFSLASDVHSSAADVLVANILANPLKILAPLLCELVKPGGCLVLSGILESQWQEVAQMYAPLVSLAVWRAQDGWVCLVGRRVGTSKKSS